MDTFLGHFLHTGDGTFGVFLVIEGDDLDIVGFVADLHTAGFVEPGSEGLHGAHIGNTPGRCGSAGDADEADFQRLVRRRYARAQRRRQNYRQQTGLQQISSFHGQFLRSGIIFLKCIAVNALRREKVFR
jgi:hypothetical protein